jgi:hypothetical protein
MYLGNRGVFALDRMDAARREVIDWQKRRGGRPLPAFSGIADGVMAFHPVFFILPGSFQPKAERLYPLSDENGRKGARGG